MITDMCSVAPVNHMPKVVAKKIAPRDGQNAATPIAKKDVGASGTKKV